MQTLKYGLTTALRAFEFPNKWDGVTQIIAKNLEPGEPEGDFPKNEFLGSHQNGPNRYFYVPPGYTGEASIIKRVEGNAANNCHIRVGKGANVKIVEEIVGSGLIACNVKLVIEEGANVQYALLQDLTPSSNAFINCEADIQDAKLHWFFCGVGGDTTQANIATNAGQNSEVVNNAVIFGTGTQQFDIHVATRHTGPNSKSDMLTRSVLDDHARAIYHGLINIGPEAPNCDSYQKDEVIILSERAGADAIPNLEIQNNQVRCTHGATIGKLDEERLFYLLSRGIHKEEAKKMITEGFLEPLFIAPWQEKMYAKAR